MTHIGTYNWSQKTQGNLNTQERVALLRPMMGMTIAYAFGRLKLLLNLRNKTPLPFDPASFTLPDSKMAQRAEEACHEMLSPALINHSYRTFFLSMALAHLDQIKPDIEYLYVTSLLHDIELENPQPHCCFAVRSGDMMHNIAQECGHDTETSQYLAESITMHATAGISYDDHLLASLISKSALLDLIGLRLHDIPKPFITSLSEKYPRNDVKSAIPPPLESRIESSPQRSRIMGQPYDIFSPLRAYRAV